MSGANHNSLLKKEQKKSLKEILFQQDTGLRLLIGILCWLILALFLHFRETRVEFLELNSTADKYIIASVDFEFPDDQATIILRQDETMSLGHVYQIDSAELRKLKHDFDNYLLQHSDWRKSAPAKNYQEVQAVFEAIKTILIKIRFADAKTLQKIKALDVSVANFLMFSPNADLVLPKVYWHYIKESFLEKSTPEELQNVKKDTISFVENFFENIQWKLTIDNSMEVYLKDKIKKNIPIIYTTIAAGKPLIERGQKVTERHLAMMKAMYQAMRIDRHITSVYTIITSLLLSLIYIFASVLFLYFAQKEVFESLQKLSLIVCVITLTLAFAKITEYIILKNPNQLVQSIHYPIIIPFASLLLTILINPRIALYFSFLFSIILSITLAVEHSCFLVLNIVVSLVAVMAAKNLRKRKEVFIVSGKCLLAAIVVVFTFSLANQKVWSDLLLFSMIGSVVFIFVIAILVVGLLPILESLFNVMTDITLMEYMDPSNELLRRLTLEMPGTYQHSLVLGNIAEIAAQTIGANGLFCRVATLYHDIGKLNNTHYFTENQQTGVNIHQLLTPVESAQVIISHVMDGEILARKYRLPEAFIDMIREHHGTTLVYYFYCKEVELKGGNVDEVDENLFRYPGPKPQTKESAIVMIADAAEAASRSLEDLSEQAFIDMVDRVVADRIDDGQFQECQLTFKELESIKASIVKTLMVTRHVRVKYPEKI